MDLATTFTAPYEKVCVANRQELYQPGGFAVL